MKVHRISILFIAAIMLASCKEPSQEAAPASKPKSEQATMAIPETAASENGLLKVSPGAIDHCKYPGGSIAVNLNWDITPVNGGGVLIYLQNPGEDRKLWSMTDGKGSAITGPWMREGGQIILMDGNDKNQLARVVLQGVPCKK